MNSTLDPLARQLRTLDPAAAITQDQRGSVQSAQDLHHIMRVARPVASPRRRPLVRKVALVGGLAAAAATGLFVVQVVQEPGLGATAAWAAVPSQPDPMALAAFVDRCRGMVTPPPDANDRHVVVDSDGTTREATPQEIAEMQPITPEEAATARVVIGEQRGTTGFAMLETAAGATFDCLGPIDASGGWLVGGASPAPSTQLGPQAVAVTGMGDAGSVDDPTATLTGRVGSEVASIVLHTQAQGDVTASVADGHLAVWWPGPEWGIAHTPDPLPATVTFRNGTSIETELAMVGAPADSQGSGAVSTVTGSDSAVVGEVPPVP